MKVTQDSKLPGQSLSPGQGSWKKIWTIIIGTQHCSQRPLDVIGGDNDEEDEEDLHLGAIGAEGDATEKTLSGMGGQ